VHCSPWPASFGRCSFQRAAASPLSRHTNARRSTDHINDNCGLTRRSDQNLKNFQTVSYPLKTFFSRFSPGFLHNVKTVGIKVFHNAPI
jgi:hypothetical protein